ncbi:PREDICTED: uncharacterized protein LOC105449153 [Wasmannia auropunctata]|uniref:uncharacterized protein LOC105449153 n=1 Tax=Wasmannia auropunctata TaxID=64793 RepID=UPI0005F01F71|nr:PREDICTED: uncharacterized protein LOC105449153 [Wasmannia auropunctata]
MDSCIVQINLNRSRGAQDLLMRTMQEHECDLACVSEPYRVPKDPRWIGSLEATPMAAVMWQGSRSSRPAVLINRGEGFVVGWNELAVVSCYFSPNRSVNQFRAFLAAIGDATSTLRGRPILIMGDFNAHSHLWENTHPILKGDAMATWAAVQDFRLLNRYNVATCVRPQGKSVIDLTWVSPALLPFVRAWDVAVEEEALSDHRKVTRGRRKRGAAVPALEAELALARKTLRQAIKEAKNRAWLELLGDIDRDPWGRPYKVVLGKLRPPDKPVSQNCTRGSLPMSPVAPYGSPKNSSQATGAGTSSRI